MYSAVDRYNEPLESHIATLTPGMIFGQSILTDETPVKFYSALCLNKVYVLQLSKRDFDYTMEWQERKLRNEKRQFLIEKSWFKQQSMPIKRMQAFCNQLEEVHFTNGEIVFEEGKPKKYVHIIKSGNFK